MAKWESGTVSLSLLQESLELATDMLALRNSGGVAYCYNLPAGTNFNSLEVDNAWNDSPFSVHTYCNRLCSGGESGGQKGTYCYQPPSDCAIGSLYVLVS